MYNTRITNTRERMKKLIEFTIFRICFKFISSLAERCFRVDLRCQGAANSGLFARIERAKMPKRPTDKPKSRFKNRLAIILKQILNKGNH